MGVLGFKPAISDTITVEEGGKIRHIFFDTGQYQLIAFMEPRNVPGFARDYDAGINLVLELPGGIYHFAFEAGNLAALGQKREELTGKGVEVSSVVDHGWTKSIDFKDPNRISLEYCCLTREFNAEMRAIRGQLDLFDSWDADAGSIYVRDPHEILEELTTSY
jgi:hypothetical protein